MAFSNKFTQTRDQLKEYFKKGKVPAEKHFADLIDSTVNRIDDGFQKTDELGFNIHSSNKSNTFISLFPESNSADPFFLLSKDQAKPKALKIQPVIAGKDTDKQSFYFGSNGNMGIGNIANDKLKLDVAGFVGMQGRVGNFRSGSVHADGQWHSIIKNLDNCQAFEVIARAGAMGKGKFALLNAIALGVYGKRGSKVKKSRTCYGFFWNHINLRWVGTTHNYSLQIRTNSNYGSGAYIDYRITQLWNDHLFSSKGSFYANDKG